MLTPWPVPGGGRSLAKLGEPRNWLTLVNRAMHERELAAVRRCVERGLPLGGESWSAKAAAATGLAWPPRERGRPRKVQEGASKT